VPALRKYESGVCAELCPLREAPTRGGATRTRRAARTGFTRPGCSCRPGDVSEVPQRVSRGKQVLRILRHTSASRSVARSGPPGTGSTAGGTAQTRGASSPAATTSTGGSASTSTPAGGAARASPAAATGGTTSATPTPGAAASGGSAIAAPAAGG
jgi:hypothetical protein